MKPATDIFFPNRVYQMSDAYVYTNSTAPTDPTAQYFVRKDWSNPISDESGGSYTGGNSVITTTQICNSGLYSNFREAYLSVPMVMTMSGCAIPDLSDVTKSLDYSLGLKNWFGQVIHSIQVDAGGATIVQQTAFCNIWNHFKLMTSCLGTMWQPKARQLASILTMRCQPTWQIQSLQLPLVQLMDVVAATMQTVVLSQSSQVPTTVTTVPILVLSRDSNTSTTTHSPH